MTEPAPADAAEVLVGPIAAEAERCAAMYEQGSDGRNTFTIFADYVRNRLSDPRVIAAQSADPWCYDMSAAPVNEGVIVFLSGVDRAIVGEAVHKVLEVPDERAEDNGWWWANEDSEYSDVIYPEGWMPLPVAPALPQKEPG